MSDGTRPDDRSEPVARSRASRSAKPTDGERAHVREQVRSLAGDQPYAILCTQGDGQPYGSLVAFAASGDLTQLVFATPTATRKYRLLVSCPRVSLVIDDRADRTSDVMSIEAVTVTGRAVELKDANGRSRWSSLLLERHPHLRSFVEAPSCAVFRVDVVRYLHVSAFQHVRQWVP